LPGRRATICSSEVASCEYWPIGSEAVMAPQSDAFAWASASLL